MSTDRKYVLVTGGSRGIGRGIAQKLGSKGAHVAIHYFQNTAAADETLRLVRQAGGDGFTLKADVTKEQDVRRIFDEVKSQFGALDVFVSNARPEVPEFFQPPFEITVQQWSASFNSQATAFLVAAQQAARLMRDNGRIIAITYGAGSKSGSLQPWVGMGSAKAALEALVRYFAVALAPRGITVNAVSPGWTEDSVLNSLPLAVQELIRGWHTRGWTPMGRLGTPADVGNVVGLLCDPDAGWITGQLIYADGGASLMNPEVPSEIQLPAPREATV
ncbi:MAG TPA: SDR family oxidoreductase [Gemmatimonadaceae bacterium]|nr:SDR family oxidoreductase [Gemmatimonadaceae bacterium]